MEGALPSGVVHQLRMSLCQTDSLSRVGWTLAECPALLELDGGFCPLVGPLLQSSPGEAERLRDLPVLSRDLSSKAMVKTPVGNRTRLCCALILFVHLPRNHSAGIV